jgi:hypothetical protein
LTMDAHWGVYQLGRRKRDPARFRNGQGSINSYMVISCGTLCIHKCPQVITFDDILVVGQTSP